MGYSLYVLGTEEEINILVEFLNENLYSVINEAMFTLTTDSKLVDYKLSEEDSEAILGINYPSGVDSFSRVLAFVIMDWASKRLRRKFYRDYELYDTGKDFIKNLFKYNPMIIEEQREVERIFKLLGNEI